MKKTKKHRSINSEMIVTLGFVFFSVFVGLMISCSQFMLQNNLEAPDKDKISIDFNVSFDIPRTVSYTIPDIKSYCLSGNVDGSSPQDLGEWTNLSDASLTLHSGTWNFTLNAYNTENKQILQGSLNNMELTQGTTLSFALTPLESGTGAIDVTVSWPNGSGVDSVTTIFDGETISPALDPIKNDDAGTWSVKYSSREVDSGEKVVIFKLLDANKNLVTLVMEKIYVRMNLTSSKTIALSEAELNSPPASPANLAAANGGNITSSTSGSISLSWTDNSLNESGFEIQYSDDNGTSWTALSSQDAGTTSCSDTLTRGSTRQYRIRAINSFGVSEWSATAGFTAPYLISFDSQSGSDVSPVENNSDLGITEPEAPTRDSYTFDGWYTDTDFTIAWEFDSDMVSGNMTLYAKWERTSLQIVFPFNNSVINDTTPLFDWENVSRASAYHIQVIVNDIIFIDKSVTESEYQIENALTETGPYEWHVSTVYTGSIESDWSDSVSFSLKTIAISSPNGRENWMLGSSQTISWNSIGIENVRIELFRNGSWEYIDGGSAIFNTGNFTWVVAGAIATDCRIRVSEANGTIQDQSDDDFALSIRVLHVDASANSGGNGESWGTAFQTIKEGIAAASSGEEVWVKAGTYSRVGSETVLVTLKAGVAVYGGFSGNETVRDDRDWENNTTTMDGGNAVTNVVKGADNAILDGFTTTGISSTKGKGALSSTADNLKISNCIFTGNDSYGSSVGGAVSVTAGSIDFQNCTFSSNSSEDDGGAIYSYGTVELSLANCSFDSNSAADDDGGAIFIKGDDASTNIQDCTFTNNEINNWNGGDGSGGAISFNGKSLIIKNCIFEYNVADGDDADDIGYGGAIHLESVDYGTISISNSRFYRNKGDIGGAIHVKAGGDIPIDVNNSTFINNTAHTNGGAIAAKNADFDTNPLIILNCSFGSNDAQDGNGGAVYAYNYCEITVINSTFDDNWDVNGRRAFYAADDKSKFDITYTLFSKHDDQFISGKENLSGYVGFIDKTSDLHINSSSDAIGAANKNLAPELDKDGYPRDSSPDMGAYEYH